MVTSVSVLLIIRHYLNPFPLLLDPLFAIFSQFWRALVAFTLHHQFNPKILIMLMMTCSKNISFIIIFTTRAFQTFSVCHPWESFWFFSFRDHFHNWQPSTLHHNFHSYDFLLFWIRLEKFWRIILKYDAPQLKRKVKW